MTACCTKSSTKRSSLGISILNQLSIWRPTPARTSLANNASTIYSLQHLQFGPLRSDHPAVLFDDTTTEGLGGALSTKSGQRVDGLSNVLPASSPGCWMARNSVRSSGVKQGPQTSAPVGA